MIDLRRRAEQQLGPRVLAQSRLAYELELLQIELELQNEELRLSRHELRDVRARYHELYEHAPVGYVTVDAFGRIVECNAKLADLLATHRGEVVGSLLSTFTSDDDADTLQTHLREVELEVPRAVDLHFVRSDGAVVPVRLEIVLLGDSSYRIAVMPR